MPTAQNRRLAAGEFDRVMGKSDTRQKTPIEDLFSPPPTAEELEPESLLYDYGVGIDCHSRFIELCVLVLHKRKLV